MSEKIEMFVCPHCAPPYSFRMPESCQRAIMLHIDREHMHIKQSMMREFERQAREAREEEVAPPMLLPRDPEPIEPWREESDPSNRPLARMVEIARLGSPAMRQKLRGGAVAGAVAEKLEVRYKGR